jgi:hypothetical protein
MRLGYGFPAWARLGHKTVDAALGYQHSQDGRDAIVAAALSANALAELEAAAQQIDTDDLADEPASELTESSVSSA